VFPRFYWKSVIDQEKTKKTGEQCFKDEEYVILETPGNRMERSNRPVKPGDRIRFNKYYDHWKNNRDFQPDGFPLEHWTLLKPSELAGLRGRNVVTVEQLANMPETDLPKMMPNAVALQIKAQEFLKAKSDGGRAAALMTQVEDLQKQMVLKDETLTELKAQVNALYAQLKVASPVVQTGPLSGPTPNPPKPVPEVKIPQ